MIIYPKTKAAGTTLGICWVQVERSFSTHITFCTLHILLAEASSSHWVTDSWLGPIPVAMAGKAVGEAVKPGSTPVTLSPCDSGFAPALPVVPVALRGGGPNGAPPGTVAAFAASQGVEAEGMRVTHLTLGPDRVGRAEALPRHLFTKAWATVAWLAVWESVVAHSTASALPPNDTGPARALPALWVAVMANGPSRVALTRQCALVVKGHQGPGGVLAESRGRLGAILRTFLLEPSQSQPPLALRCQTQLDLQQ